MSSTRPTASLVPPRSTPTMERAGLKAGHHLPVPGPPRRGRSGPRYHGVHCPIAGNSSWRGVLTLTGRLASGHPTIPDVVRVRCGVWAAGRPRNDRRTRRRPRRPPPKARHEPEQTTSPIPSTTPGVCGARGPTRPSSHLRARAAPSRARDSGNGRARATSVARGAGPARGARAADEPASIYRADRRAQSRSERPDLALVPGSERRRRRFHWWYLLAIPLALAIAFGVWGYAGYSTFNKAVVKSNHRITRATRAALVDPHGGVLERPDHAARARLRPARPRAGPLRQHPAHAVRPQERTP